ncbi:MAG: hypothetical protein HC929_12890 [Leptolyngbyaceae cyanobacterium SM2_5_2]|nr:hypothetical protein [Leptolyngbyaceae cyanobacterium SM2_5_2]
MADPVTIQNIYDLFPPPNKRQNNAPLPLIASSLNLRLKENNAPLPLTVSSLNSRLKGTTLRCP